MRPPTKVPSPVMARFRGGRPELTSRLWNSWAEVSIASYTPPMPDERPLLLRDPRFREHREPGSHPERSARLDAIDRALEPLSGRTDPIEPRPADLDLGRCRGGDTHHLAVAASDPLPLRPQEVR